MISLSVVKKIISRFERAVHVRACALAAGHLDHAITFEYRQSKRELLALVNLLRTGENPDNSMEDRSYWIKQSPPNRKVGMESSGSSEPKNPSPR